MRLTKHVRDEIIKKALEHTFSKREADHEKRKMALADAIYTLFNGAGEKLAKKVPAGWIPEMTHLVFVHPDWKSREWNSAVTPYSRVKLSKPRLQPHSHPNYQLLPAMPLYDVASELSDSIVALDKERAELQIQLSTLTYSVQTTEKLKAAWPKGVKFFPTESRAAMLPVPVDLPKKIDAAMGL